MLDERYKETKKSQLPLLKSLEQKQGTVHIPCTQHHLREGAAKHPSHTLTLTPHKEQALPPPPRGASEGNPDALGAPVKPCLNLALVRIFTPRKLAKVTNECSFYLRTDLPIHCCSIAHII